MGTLQGVSQAHLDNYVAILQQQATVYGELVSHAPVIKDIHGQMLTGHPFRSAGRQCTTLHSLLSLYIAIAM